MIPTLPENRGEATGALELSPRYEDITQDGRLILTAMMPGLGCVWRKMRDDLGGFDSVIAKGIIPILRRVIIVGDVGPTSVNVPIAFEGQFRLMREKGGERLFCNMWLEARAQRATTFGPPPAKDAPRELVGRVFAEHVVTKPFAPPADRKVSLDDLASIPTFAALLHEDYEFLSAESLVDGATLAPAAEISFGMMHTDSNQHVNSLVYPRMFEEAVVRHRTNLSNLCARAVEMRWRKPFFAGDRASIALAMTDERTAVGTFGKAPAANGGDSKPHCAMRLTLG